MQGVRHLLITLGGIFVLLLLATDVFMTVFLERGGLLHNGQNRAVWAVLRAVALRFRGSTRASILSLGGPILAVLTIVTWILLLVVGFALLYAPHVSGFIYIGGEPTSQWAEAFYFSAVVSSTLGFGDIVPASPVVRLLSGLHGLLGLALFGLTVTYVLSVYNQSTRARALALAIGAYLDPGVDEAINREGLDTVSEWSQRIAMRLLEILQAHLEYPILHYFRSRDTETSLPAQMRRLLDLVERMEEAELPGGEPTGRRPSSLLLRRAVENYVRRAEQGFIPSRSMHQARLEERDLEDAYDRLMRYLGFSQDAEM